MNNLHAIQDKINLRKKREEYLKVRPPYYSLGYYQGTATTITTTTIGTWNGTTTAGNTTRRNY